MQQARKPARRVGLRRRKAETGHRKEPAHQKNLARAAVRVGFGPFRDFQIASGALRFVNRRAASRSIHRRRNQVDWIHIEKVMVAGSWVANQKISQNFHFFKNILKIHKPKSTIFKTKFQTFQNMAVGSSKSPRARVPRPPRPVWWSRPLFLVGHPLHSARPAGEFPNPVCSNSILKCM